MKRLVAGTVAATLSIMPLVGSFAFATPAWANGLSAISQISTVAKENPQSDFDWSLDESTKKGGEVLEKKYGWYHFKSSSQNGNSAENPSQYPAIAVNKAEYNFADSSGVFTTVIKTKEDGGKNRFGFYLGYKNPNSGLFIGFDDQGWFWQRYGGDGEYFKGKRAAPPQDGRKTEVNIRWGENTAVVRVDRRIVLQVDYSSMKDKLSNKLAIKAGSYKNDITDIEVRDPNAPSLTYSVSGKILGQDNAPLKNARVQCANKVVNTNNNGEFSINDLEPGKFTLSAIADGYDEFTKEISVSDSDSKLGDITLQKTGVFDTETLKTEDMEAVLHKNFPAVSYYKMLKLENRIMEAQRSDIRTVSINGVNVKLQDSDVTFKKIDNTKAQYVLKVKNADKNIDAEITVDMSVKANQLHFNVTKIVNNAGESHPIQTLYFPGNNLVSVTSSQEGATFTGARMSSNTTVPGDTTVAVTNGYSIRDKGDYTYGFVSNNQLSAGLWSNSENEGTAAYSEIYGGAHNTRVIASTKSEFAGTRLGLTSAPWYYHRVVEDSKGRRYTVPETDMPKMSVSIAGDLNGDNSITWQDGAIAYRDIMNNPYKYEEVPELVAWRIAMNFGGQAQNPFLTTLDNVKKVALNTDGLGQSVLLKGYGNEGHDSGHPDYADIGKRLGGADDMNTLMKKGKKYGARFGVHVNASEMYPEAKAFTEDMVRRRGSSLSYGWNWLDQGIGIDGIYDLASNSREKRFDKLKEEVKDNMDFIYLDVWGNLVSGNREDSWETRKMSKMINKNGWRMTTEWGAGNEYDSTFQHWAADLTYGDARKKGENSQVMRFLRNHQKDSWVGDYPTYYGAANAPLLGGYNMKDFEGWQGRNDYDAYIRNLFTHDLSTKFIQHFKVSRWVNSPLDSSSVRDRNTNNGSEQIDLVDNHGNKLVIARGSNNSGLTAYRNRTITLNGKLIATGAVTPGDGKGVGNESYLLPWMWDVNTGKLVDDSKQKLYHWNTVGGTTTWKLPNGWENLANVSVYKLTDLGKTERTVVNVTNGQITLNALAKTPYVIYKGDAKAEQLHVTWSEDMHIVDAGFNGGEESLKKNWNIEGNGTASIAKSQFSNPMLKLTGKVKTTQKLTDLKPGKRYALYVGVDNRSDAAARMTVRSGGKVLASNSTMRSIAENYVKAYSHNTRSATVGGSSYFQNMYVFFDAPQSGETTLELEHLGAGDTYFDDVRVVENEYKGLKFNSKGEVIGLENDFEHNAQGIWPFVISGSEYVEDNRIHLSEKHAPFTQAGWDVKEVDDVLGGNWSVKINGLVRKNNLVYRTIPQNFTFKPGKKYTVEFDYQSGSNGTYAVAIGNGDFASDKVSKIPLDEAKGTTKHHKFTVIGGDDGDTWFGIFSTSTAEKLPSGVSPNSPRANFGGYRDFILDNLKIKEDDSVTTREQAQNKYNEIKQKWDSKRKNFAESAQRTYVEKMALAHSILNRKGAKSEDFASAVAILEYLDSFMKTAPALPLDDKFDVARNEYDISVGSAQEKYGNEGPAEFAVDNDPNTWWHTAWDESAVYQGDAWFEFTLKKPMTISALRYLPRSSGDNGKIIRYKVTITPTEGEPVIKSGTFKNNGNWEKVDFGKPIENVKKVRLTASSSSGAKSDERNRFASAAELRLTTNREIQDIKIAADKTELKSVIKKAGGLSEADYAADKWSALQKAIESAKSVDKNADATVEDVQKAIVELRAAMKETKAAESINGNAPVDPSTTVPTPSVPSPTVPSVPTPTVPAVPTVPAPVKPTPAVPSVPAPVKPVPAVPSVPPVETVPSKPAPENPAAPAPAEHPAKPAPVKPAAPTVPAPAPSEQSPAPVQPAPANPVAPTNQPAPAESTPDSVKPAESAPAPAAPATVQHLKAELNGKLTVGNDNVAQPGVVNKVLLNITNSEFYETLKRDGVAYAYAYIYSSPRLLKGADGSKYVTVRIVNGKPQFDAMFPDDYSGKHTVALVDKKGKQIAWTNIVVANSTKKATESKESAANNATRLTNSGVNVISVLAVGVLLIISAGAILVRRAI